MILWRRCIIKGKKDGEDAPHLQARASDTCKRTFKNSASVVTFGMPWTTFAPWLELQKRRQISVRK